VPAEIPGLPVCEQRTRDARFESKSPFGRNMLVARVDTRRRFDRVARRDPDAFEAFCDCYGARVKVD